MFDSLIKTLDNLMKLCTQVLLGATNFIQSLGV